MWEKRNQTIAVLATATLVFARLRFTEHTVLTHLSTLLGTLFAAGVAYVQLAPKLFPSLPSPPSEEPDVTLSEQYMRKLIDSSLPRANRTLVFLFQASRFHEMADLTKAAGVRPSLPYYQCALCLIQLCSPSFATDHRLPLRNVLRRQIHFTSLSRLRCHHCLPHSAKGVQDAPEHDRPEFASGQRTSQLHCAAHNLSRLIAVVRTPDEIIGYLGTLPH